MPTELEFYEEAQRVLIFAPLEGRLLNRWYRSSNSRKGDEAGGLNQAGYRQITISLNGSYRVLLAHRIIWFIHTGRIPKEIDHINRVRDDNRLENLREVVRGENARNKGRYSNNKSGYKGVTWHKPGRKWRANIRIDGKNRHLGYFLTAEEAHAAYMEAAERRDAVAHGQDVAAEPGDNQCSKEAELERLAFAKKWGKWNRGGKALTVEEYEYLFGE